MGRSACHHAQREAKPCREERRCLKALECFVVSIALIRISCFAFSAKFAGSRCKRSARIYQILRREGLVCSVYIVTLAMQFLKQFTGRPSPSKPKPSKPEQLPPTGLVEQPGPPRAEVEAATARLREQDELEVLKAEERDLTELQQEQFVAHAGWHFEEVELEAASS
eukprot:5458036-Amphidinium_carterae.1